MSATDKNTLLKRSSTLNELWNGEKKTSRGIFMTERWQTSLAGVLLQHLKRDPDADAGALTQAVERNGSFSEYEFDLIVPLVKRVATDLSTVSSN